MAEFKSRDLLPISVSCAPIVFIVSLNDDDDNDNRVPDFQEVLPLKDKTGATVVEDNLRQFDFNFPAAASVVIQQVVEIPSSKPVVGQKKRVRAYEADRQTPFQFGLRTVPVTMYLEGVQRPSLKLNDIGFEYSYFKDRAGKHELCGNTAIGTVVKVDAKFDVESSGGASFKKHNKMLIDGEAEARVTVTPAGAVTPLWSTDDPLGSFSAPSAFQTHYDAGALPTPPGTQGYVRVTLTAIASQPPGQVIEANIPVILSAPTKLRLDQGVTNPATNLTATNTGKGTLNLLKAVFPYQILDQNDVQIHDDTAYAKRVPTVRENIRAVLTSPIPDIQNWVTNGLKSTNDWIDKPSGKFNDRIEITGLDKDSIITLVRGQRRFVPAVDHPGAVVIEVPPPSTHIWYLGVRKPGDTTVWGIQEGCHNDFPSTVSAVTPATPGAVVREIDIRSTYTVHTP